MKSFLKKILVFKNGRLEAPIMGGAHWLWTFQQWPVVLLWLGNSQCQYFQVLFSQGQLVHSEDIPVFSLAGNLKNPVGKRGWSWVGPWGMPVSQHLFCSSRSTSVIRVANYNKLCWQGSPSAEACFHGSSSCHTPSLAGMGEGEDI